ncbi:DoxX-like family protein [Singulisphaera sp. GP187]|uniref:DoxX family protein n=1 Tax=Singulisphaera sp. GP187 TaxID=1882752 RepID=UPI00092930CE|nr:DoxX family protein [Singulisphaera sp. GP187]SIO55908.1 DoxX-like family protein [Singulisphaera sp. GP187]
MVDVQDSASAAKPGRGANVGLWILQVLLAAAFLGAGGAKLAGVEMMVEEFRKVGLGQWFRCLTGTLEVLAAVLLIVPRTSGLGALLLAPIMIGAVVAHLVVLKSSPAAPLVLLALAAVVAWGRRDSIRVILGWGGPARV